jgi:hypothetical protein
LPLSGEKADNLQHIFGSKSSGAKERYGLCVVWPLSKAIRLLQFAFLGWFGAEQLTLRGVGTRVRKRRTSVLVFPPVVLSSFFQSRAFLVFVVAAKSFAQPGQLT